MTDCGPPEGKQHLHQRVLEAAETPAKVKDIAAYAGVHRSTITRWYDCLDGLANPEKNKDEACDICTEYTRARGEGIIETLKGCSKEYLASLHGYSRKVEQDVQLSGDPGGAPVKVLGFDPAGYPTDEDEEGDEDD